MRKKTLLKRMAAMGMAAAMTISSLCLPDTGITVYAAELAEEEVLLGEEDTEVSETTGETEITETELEITGETEENEIDTQEADAKEVVIYENTAESAAQIVDFTSLTEEDWTNTISTLTYAADIQNATADVAENAIVRGTIAVDEALYNSLSADGSYIKLQSVMKLGADWTWTEGAEYPYLDKNAFTKKGETYTSEFSVKYADITPGALHEIIFRIVGIGAKGTYTISNVSISNVEKGSASLPQKEPFVVDDFEKVAVGDGAGWAQESGWQYGNSVTVAVAEKNSSKQLKVGLDYTGCETYTWSEAKIKKNFTGIDVSAYNLLTYEITYPAAFEGFKAKVFAQNYDSGTEKATEIINKEGVIESTDLGNGMKKATVTV